MQHVDRQTDLFQFGKYSDQIFGDQDALFPPEEVAESKSVEERLRFRVVVKDDKRRVSVCFHLL